MILRATASSPRSTRAALAHDALDDALDLAVAELRLGLAFELGVRDLHRHHRGQALAHVVARHADFRVLHHAFAVGVVRERAGERRAEAHQVRAALDRVDVVHERVHGLVVAIVVLERDLGRDAVALAPEEHRLRVQRLLVLVQVFSNSTMPPSPRTRRSVQRSSTKRIRPLFRTPARAYPHGGPGGIRCNRSWRPGGNSDRSRGAPYAGGRRGVRHMPVGFRFVTLPETVARTSTAHHADGAFTTDTPTPRPPEPCRTGRRTCRRRARGHRLERWLSWSRGCPLDPATVVLPVAVLWCRS